MNRRRLFLALITSLAAAGCSHSASDDPQASGGNQRALANDPGPAKAVDEFLSAVRAANDQKAAMMLTETARKKTKEMNVVVAPPGSPTASFKVGETEMVEEGARVRSFWTDLGEDGKHHTDEIIWFLRQEPEGWRIAGMAMQIFEDQKPLLLNFEDPADMLRKQKLAEEEMARRTEGKSLEAKRPSAAGTLPR